VLILQSNGKLTWRPLVPLGIHRDLLDLAVAVAVVRAAVDVLPVGRNQRAVEVGVDVEARQRVDADDRVILWPTLFPRRRARCTLRVSFIGIVRGWPEVDATLRGLDTAALPAFLPGCSEVLLRIPPVRLGGGQVR